MGSSRRATTRRTGRSSCGRRTSGSWPRPICSPGQHVIDIACGTGMVTLPAAAAVGPDGHVLATDLSQKMVDDTERRARLAGLANVEVRRCDAEQLDATGPFDVALCSLGLMYVPSPPAAIGEMHRVLRPGGRSGRVGVGRAAQLRMGRAVPDRRRPGQQRRVPDVLRPRHRRLPRRPHRARRLHRRRAGPAERRSRLRRRGRRARRGVPRRTGRPRLLPVRRRDQGLGARRLPGVDRPVPATAPATGSPASS